MKATVKWKKGMYFEATDMSNHVVPLDADEEEGGKNLGTRPMELLLIGLGGCTGMDVISILRKMRQEVKSFEIRIEAYRAEDHPKVFTYILVKYLFKGKNLREKDVEKAVNLSKDRYCSASVMLGKTAKVEHQFEILE